MNQLRQDNYSLQTSDNGLNFIKEFEAFVPKPYLDARGKPTIGYGTTIYPDSRKKVTMQDDWITEKTASWYLKLHCIGIEKAIKRMVVKKLNQNQFDALVSFVYNVGEGNFRNSTLLKRINADPNDADIHNQLLRWVFAGGKKLAGLERRRIAESKLYFK